MLRRDLLKWTSGLMLPNMALRSTGNTRRFLFVFCDGGWDPTLVFAPLFDNSNVYYDSQDQMMTFGDLQLVDNPNRPKIREFFEKWQSKSFIINGIDVETIAHDRAKRTFMTGLPYGSDDWGAIIGAHSPTVYTAPHLILSGPSFSTQFSNSILRVGLNGELQSLLSNNFDLGVQPTMGTEDLIAEYLSNRATQTALPSDIAQQMQSDYLQSQMQLQHLKDIAPSLNLNGNNGQYGADCNETFMSQAQIALDFFANDLSKTAVVQDNGYCRMRWDSHGDIREQTWHFDLLFNGLLQLMTALENTVNIHGIPLIDEVTVVLCSEMGRHPQLNAMGGKHHWPVTSMMFINGPQGGRTIGGYSDQVLARNIDLESGELHPQGAKPTCEHIGATILAMADIDPLEFTSVSPIQAAL